ncbi:Trans-2,3-enoyl-CoA reductase [Tetrabaena socialis]|uniref:Trans-2,3-enoyl-CoA reductase n=1 Tax=Tetrabaena socialis TaxID=47790 RepID=A0A2J7ZY43_9CHLO|nr:Trans-2,3-enoyl-CoA reductase [Tetrabaena socialis]|eukprot:PNH05191.1 Trans-2,3-enoyl-CoA reductase [Tetrabaena socialis]
MGKLEVASRSGRIITTIDINGEATVSELKRKFQSYSRKYYPARQRFSLPVKAGEKRGVVLEDGKRLADYGLAEGGRVDFKDLGPQIGYSTVFFWEYFGPLVVYPLFFFFPQYLYPHIKSASPPVHSLVQKLAVAYWCFHYAKRIVETYTIHKFGHATMPIFNLFRNCAYYWGFAAYVSYFVNHPKYTAPNQTLSVACLGLAVLMQLGNLRSHIILANLRAPGEKDYKIPRGFLFNFVSCANYTFEIWGWLLYSVAVQSLAAWMFAATGAAQMVQWAIAKHSRLRKTFDGKDGRPKYPRRWIIFPPFL